METWYVADSGYRTQVQQVEIERFTQSSVWVNGGRKARMSDYKAFFPTEMEAYKHLLEMKTQKVEDAKRRVQYAKDEYSRAVQGVKDLEKAIGELKDNA